MAERFEIRALAFTAYVPTWDPDRRIPPVARAVLEQVAMADTTSAQD
jgi:hypothetical protein